MPTADEWTGGVTAEELHKVWGGQLRPIPPPLIPPGVSAPTRVFLTDVGLPTEETNGISFVHDERLARPLVRQGHQHLLIANYFDDCAIGVDLASDHLAFIYQGRSEEAEFANSNLALFVLFTGRYERDVIAFLQADFSEERMAEAVRRFQEGLNERDPRAAEPGSFWAGMLTGLLEG